MSNDKNIRQVAEDAGSFKTLLKALEVTDMTSAVEGSGPLTVFAPTDEAFAKLPAGTLEELLADTDKLGMILKSHVLSGKVMSYDIHDGDDVTTLSGSHFSAKVNDGGVFLGNAKVIQADIMASNGVIHVIDTVLIP